jgi:RNA polymerase sigma-70 factor (ECF subfamily)
VNVLSPLTPVNPNPGSDLADWHALRAGDDDALGRMIARWEKPLFNFAWRYVRNTADARDLSAEVFVRLYQHRERLVENSNISAWLFTTLVNLCRNRHRWRERHPSVSLDEPAAREPATEAPAPGDAMERRETLEALGAAIDRLPHELKATLLLHHYDHLSYREIGEITGCSERGVETRLYRARQRLRDDLAGLRVEAGR